MTNTLDNGNSMRDWQDDLRVAVGLLTRIPMAHPDGPAPSYLARAMRVFPLVGAGVGAAVGVVYLGLLLVGVPVLPAAALALGVSALLTGALHEDGLADTGDGFGGGHDKARKLEIMRDSRLGTYGAVVLMVTFAAKLFALAALPRVAVLPVLVTAHALGRAAIPALAFKLPAARTDGLGARAGSPTQTVVVTAGVIAAVLTLIMLPLKEALLSVAVALLAAAAVGALARRQIGGQTGDVLGAAEQAVEVAVLVLCATRFG
ncbi:adenosylcobinamide-GDP ribazoletransferase [Rhodoplanes sp. TEM]|uniref:Adenosylcobinamide-GDP ribazoletransferase n=1 Tax=Rhodoplanes tepidamans TaxID=200616 RepID=A0ABT5JIH7_RHOTP|nr:MULTISPECIES: adenosylcobinamide-GDP ribazoletransferase [Rhodoplanes]MDC7789109.1 adenosylcobinamide-GDP ribazoletransferase [Rhodoplanes tepidamans]MDC7982726.1 adenosylcobinamide-GDP ribazoletransferase [Rhodoplanes sp. TEM]MDQ0357445.1 adenosylcobinamide-GDP ribazoletransferase [Rhodoplanes tepidamans]